MAVVAKLITGCTLIFDSHEDYFHQAYEYGGRTPLALLRAWSLRMTEVALVRFTDAVFCTDEHLTEQYSRRLYGAKAVHLLRNFPIAESNQVARSPVRASRGPTQEPLRLVYVGGVNAYRGVIECAQFARRFNQEVQSPRLELTIHAHDGPLVRRLVDGVTVRFGGWLGYEDLMRKLETYDVGICLWQRLKKFERNLPLKNFDYMAAGLAIITSDFGNLKKYAVQSGAAICIDPSSYDEFAAAVLRFSNEETRSAMGKRGREYVSSIASFRLEAQNYVALISQATAGKSRV